MNRKLSILVFVVLAVAIIALAMWYNNKSDEEMNAAEVQASAAAAQAAAQAQQQFMAELKINDVTVGVGAVAQAGDSVTVNYTGTLDNGTVFDSSYSRHEPFTFTLGAGNVIKGWDLGVAGMKVGGKRTLVIPSDLGYGNQAVGPIPASSTLHFTVELLSVGAPTSSGATGSTGQ